MCRTDLHLRDDEIEATKLPVVLGHQIVATTEDGRRVGVPWLGWTDGTCRYCQTDRENLCVNARFTGRDIDGGYRGADRRRRAILPPAPRRPSPTSDAAPLLCGGLIGYRALRFTGDATKLGLYGFGSAAHMICQVAVYQGREVYAFTRPQDERTQTFAKTLGATWAGGSDEQPPEQLDAAIIFASAGELVPEALKALAPGGTVVCAGIHMTDIPELPLRRPVGGADDPLGREPHPPRRRRVPRARAEGAGPHDRDDLPARARRAGARRSPRRPLRGHRAVIAAVDPLRCS